RITLALVQAKGLHVFREEIGNLYNRSTIVEGFYIEGLYNRSQVGVLYRVEDFQRVAGHVLVRDQAQQNAIAFFLPTQHLAVELLTTVTEISSGFSDTTHHQHVAVQERIRNFVEVLLVDAVHLEKSFVRHSVRGNDTG